MAGAPELFYVFKLLGTEHNVDSWYPTQAGADAAAVAGGEDFAANTGAVEVPAGWETGWLRNPDDGEWRTFGVVDLDETALEVYEAQLTHDAYFAWEQHLAHVAHYFPPADLAKVAAALAYVHRGTRGVFLSTHWTHAEKIAFARESRKGPSGFTLGLDPDDNAANLLAYIEANFDSIDTPTDRIVFVDPSTGLRIAANKLVDEAPDIRANMAAETDDLTDYVNAKWTKEIGQSAR